MGIYQCSWNLVGIRNGFTICSRYRIWNRTRYGKAIEVGTEVCQSIFTYVHSILETLKIKAWRQHDRCPFLSSKDATPFSRSPIDQPGRLLKLKLRSKRQSKLLRRVWNGLQGATQVVRKRLLRVNRIPIRDYEGVGTRPVSMDEDIVKGRYLVNRVGGFGIRGSVYQVRDTESTNHIIYRRIEAPRSSADRRRQNLCPRILGDGLSERY